MNRTAESTLPKLEEIRPKNEMWKYDEYLNTLIDQRKQTTRNSVEFKNVTKQIKCRVKYLNNEKCSKEAASINEYATRRQIDELFRKFKSDNSTFTKPKNTTKCDPILLKDYFKNHFTKTEITEDPIELVQLPDFLKNLQEIDSSEVKTSPP